MEQLGWTLSSFVLVCWQRLGWPLFKFGLKFELVWSDWGDLAQISLVLMERLGWPRSNFVLVFKERLRWPRFKFVLVCLKRMGWPRLNSFWFVWNHRGDLAVFFFFSPDAKLPRWGYLIPFITLSLEGGFRGCFARGFTFLLVPLLFIRFISFTCSESLVSALPSLYFRPTKSGREIFL